MPLSILYTADSTKVDIDNCELLIELALKFLCRVSQNKYTLKIKGVSECEF